VIGEFRSLVAGRQSATRAPTARDRLAGLGRRRSRDGDQAGADSRAPNGQWRAERGSLASVGRVTRYGALYATFSHPAVSGVESLGCEAVNTIELPLAFVTAGLLGLGGLALVMGAALSSLAELLALLPRHGGWAGGSARAPRAHVLASEVRRPSASALVAALLGGQTDPGAPTHRSDVSEVRDGSQQP
jgi:hypothetical protein